MEAIAAEAIRKLHDFHPQNFTNLAWAFARLELRHDPLFYAISAQALAIITEFNSQNLGNTAWAFASLGYLDMRFLQAM